MRAPKNFTRFIEINEKGKPVAYNNDGLREYFQSHPGTRIEVKYKVLQDDPTQTDQMRKYYRCVVIPWVKQGLLGLGIRMYDEDVHEHLRQRSYIGVTFYEVNGEQYKKVQTTGRGGLDKEDWMLYLEECIQYAAEELNIVIPEANHNITDLTK